MYIYPEILTADELRFDWDASNTDKLAKHGVCAGEAEEIFGRHDRLRVFRARAVGEERFLALGQMGDGRLIAVILDEPRPQDPSDLGATDESQRKEVLRVMSPAKVKQIPEFASEQEEAEWWGRQAEWLPYFDTRERPDAALPSEAKSTERVTVRMPAWLLASIKLLAAEQDVPYQSLMKRMLVRQVAQQRFEIDRARGSA